MPPKPLVRARSMLPFPGYGGSLHAPSPHTAHSRHSPSTSTAIVQGLSNILLKHMNAPPFCSFTLSYAKGEFSVKNVCKKCVFVL